MSACGRPRKDLNEEEKRWLIDFLAQVDLIYTNPGRKDNVYIGKENCERIYKQRLYLLWNLRDIIDIGNGSGKIKMVTSFIQTFTKSLTFSQLYNFLKACKEYSYNKTIPHGSCLCDIFEHCVLLAKGLNKKIEEPLPKNPHNLVEKLVEKCVLDQCQSCSSNNFNFVLKKDHDNSGSPESEEETDVKWSFFSWTKIENRIRKATFAVAFEDAVATMKEKLIVLKEHIFVKRIQD